MVQERFQVGSGRLTVFNSWTGEQCGAYRRVAGYDLDFGLLQVLGWSQQQL